MDTKVKVRMLGNVEDLVVGEEYELPVGRANQLTGLGFAVLVRPAADAADREE